MVLPCDITVKRGQIDESTGFLKALARDLRLLGHKASFRRRGDSAAFLVRLTRFSETMIKAQMACVRKSQLFRARDFIEDVEHKLICDLLISGLEMRPERIAPQIQVCQSHNDHAIYRYCRLMQTIPSNSRVGRQMNFLVYDTGQGKCTLIGVIGLASPLYAIACRDEYFGWSGRTRLKLVGLRRVMDVAVCMAIPPYSYLLGGKLLASLAASDSVAREYRARYRTPLLALTTTCAIGLHAPVFNRIMLRRGGLYRRVGATAGYTTAFFSPDTIEAAKRMLECDAGWSRQELNEWNHIRLLRSVLRSCRIPADPLLTLGTPKGVLVAVLSVDGLDGLRSGRVPSNPDYLPSDKCVAYWRSTLLPRRLARPDVVSAVSRHRPSQVLLTRSVR